MKRSDDDGHFWIGCDPDNSLPPRVVVTKPQHPERDRRKTDADSGKPNADTRTVSMSKGT